MAKFKKILKDIENNIEDEKLKNYFYGQKSRFFWNFQSIKRYLKKDDRILEVGSCPSYFLAALKRYGYNIEGLDLNPNREKSFLKREKLVVKKCDIEKNKFPYPNESFDKIILGEVFEHLYVNPIFTINEIKRILKKDGIFILTTPNGYSIKRIFNFLRGRGASENPFDEFNKVNLFGHRGHIREYSAGELVDFLKKMEMRCVKTEYISFSHGGLKKRVFLRTIVNIIYAIFPKVKSHLILIVKK